MADGLMRAGVAPRIIIDAIGLASAAGAPISKYTPDQPRVPAGQGRASGQWTAGGGGTTTLATTAVAAGAAGGGRIGLDWLGGSLERVLTALAFIGRLARLVALGDLAAPVAGFGLLFWPSRAGPKAQWVDVGGPARLRYYWSPDETLIRIQYRDASGGTRITTGRLGPGGEFRDPEGRPIARWIKAIGVVVQLASLEAIANEDFEPRLCPKPPVPDRQGAREADRDYEDFVKRSVNPQNPTPRGLGYALPNPTSKDGWTVFDDCRQSDGAMIEAKNNYAGLIERLGGHENFDLRIGWLAQADRQLAAAPDRPIIWYFNHESAAVYARNLFNSPAGGPRERIQTVYLPTKGLDH
ncbi:MAG: hypothetical protein P4L73_17030 [Caulobacteraceae bacterium]|nr:hypothetical protein [Caulobacteraceae bacterium]